MSRRELMRIAGQLYEPGEAELELMTKLAERAAVRAAEHGLELTTVDDQGHFRLERSIDGRLVWSVDLWPTVAEWSRVAWNPAFKGPVLQLPRPWTILDAVDAMIQTIEKVGTDEPPKRMLRRRRNHS